MKPKLSPLAYANFKQVLDKYAINITIDQVEEMYSERHRYYHTCEHLNNIMSCFAKLEETNPEVHEIRDEFLSINSLYYNGLYYTLLYICIIKSLFLSNFFIIN